ncbi:hypothetical protein [Laspinema olomoucense]|uniref:hypothetical protein n=1 Tax=Laspinema olomoucense TaxID=3231600 RepID=UPI0021BB6565|nr:hypothetical protein [Laspinema sp. D3d]MCT7973868.1 hypothetical protein [Laspinema sp. D3d]
MPRRFIPRKGEVSNQQAIALCGSGNIPDLNGSGGLGDLLGSFPVIGAILPLPLLRDKPAIGQ